MTNVSSYPVITKQNSVTLSTSTLKLSLHLLEIPNHSYALLSETLIGWSLCADWLILGNNEKETLHIKDAATYHRM